jgi:hypothetical protein
VLLARVLLQSLYAHATLLITRARITDGAPDLRATATDDRCGIARATTARRARPTRVDERRDRCTQLRQWLASCAGMPNVAPHSQLHASVLSRDDTHYRHVPELSRRRTGTIISVHRAAAVVTIVIVSVVARCSADAVAIIVVDVAILRPRVVVSVGGSGVIVVVVIESGVVVVTVVVIDYKELVVVAVVVMSRVVVGVAIGDDIVVTGIVALRHRTGCKVVEIGFPSFACRRHWLLPTAASLMRQ